MKIKLSMCGLNKVQWIKKLRTDVGYHMNDCYLGLRDAKYMADILWELDRHNEQPFFVIDTDEYDYLEPIVKLIFSHTESSPLVKPTDGSLEAKDYLKKALSILIEKEQYTQALQVITVIKQLG